MFAYSSRQLAKRVVTRNASGKVVKFGVQGRALMLEGLLCLIIKIKVQNI